MLELFKAHLHKFIEIDDSEFNNIIEFFRIQEVKKKENLLVEGQVCTYHYFVLNGCLRKFFVNDKGIEHTTEFALETWWMTDLFAYERRLSSDFYIQSVENATVLSLHRDAQENLLLQHPKMERYFRFIYQRAYAAAQKRMKFLFDLSKEAFYHQFSQAFPEFVQRIPQYLLASYLGFTPEYLSEIRAKKLS